MYVLLYNSARHTKRMAYRHTDWHGLGGWLSPKQTNKQTKSTSVFGDGRISTHADHIRPQAARFHARRISSAASGPRAHWTI